MLKHFLQHSDTLVWQWKHPWRLNDMCSVCNLLNRTLQSPASANYPSLDKKVYFSRQQIFSFPPSSLLVSSFVWLPAFSILHFSLPFAPFLIHRIFFPLRCPRAAVYPSASLSPLSFFLPTSALHLAVCVFVSRTTDAGAAPWPRGVRRVYLQTKTRLPGTRPPPLAAYNFRPIRRVFALFPRRRPGRPRDCLIKVPPARYGEKWNLLSDRPVPRQLCAHIWYHLNATPAPRAKFQRISRTICYNHPGKLTVFTQPR